MDDSDDDFFSQLFAGAPAMAILRGLGAERSASIAQAAWDVGITAVEIPLQTAEDEVALREVAALAESRGQLVGAGTIVTLRQVEVAERSGARFLVSPGLDASIVAAAVERGLPILPGVATPSDVQHAMALGLSWLKAFPASWLGPGWFRAMRGPFPDARFVATGGVDAGNAASFFDAGVRAVALGSGLQDAGALDQLAATLARLRQRTAEG